MPRSSFRLSDCRGDDGVRTLHVVGISNVYPGGCIIPLDREERKALRAELERVEKEDASCAK